jgi:hypothetical protein
MRPVEIVESFPFAQSGFEIDVAFVAEKLIELLLVGSMWPFDFAVQLRRCPPDIGMANTQIFDMPMKLRLELMAVTSSE